MRRSSQFTFQNARGFAEYYHSLSPKDFEDPRCYSSQLKSTPTSTSIVSNLSSGAIFFPPHQQQKFSSHQNNYHEKNSFFPLYTTTTRVQASQSLYYLKPTPSGNENIHTYPSSVSSSFSRGPQLSNNNSDPYSRGEWRKLMPQQSLLDQMSSGAIFVGKSSYQNQTVTHYNRLYEKSNPNEVPTYSKRDDCIIPPVETKPINSSLIGINPSEIERIRRIIYSNDIYRSQRELNKLMEIYYSQYKSR